MKGVDSDKHFKGQWRWWDVRDEKKQQHSLGKLGTKRQALKCHRSLYLRLLRTYTDMLHDKNIVSDY